MARHKGAEASVIWVRDTQPSAEGNHEDSDYNKLQALPESNSVKPNSGCADVARFGEAALEATRKILEDNKVIVLWELQIVLRFVFTPALPLRLHWCCHAARLAMALHLGCTYV